MMEDTAMVDIIVRDGRCYGVVTQEYEFYAEHTVLACGGIGGLFDNSTNYPQLTGDAIAICLRHGIPLKDIDYIQMTTTKETYDSICPSPPFRYPSIRRRGACRNRKDEKKP